MILRDKQDYTVLHLFSGSGGGALGFKRAGFRSLGSIDLDPIACRDLERLTGERAICADILAMGPADLAQLIGSVPDVVFTSPPCLPADGIVLTEAGPRRIDSVRAGDCVLSHKGRYCRVDKVNSRRYAGDLHGIHMVGSMDTEWFTSEHPIWARRCEWGPKKTKRRDPAWTPASQIRKGDRIGFPVPREVQGTAAAFVGQFGDPTVHMRTSHLGNEHVTRSPRTIDLRTCATSIDLWFLLGAYIGDGCRAQTRYEVAFCTGGQNSSTTLAVVAALERLGFAHHVEVTTETNVKVKVGNRHIWQLCGAFGDGALNKHIPEALMGLEDDAMRALVRGMRATDGCDVHTKKGVVGWKLTSISLQLLRDVQRLALRLGTLGTISQVLHAGRGVILGREVNISDSYALMFFRHPTRTSYWFEDGMAWLSVREVSTKLASSDEVVWNLEVDEDDTYCSHLILGHNCKGFSGCLPEEQSITDKYRAFNSLALHGVWLCLEAWGERRPKLIVLENVPRIKTRGREWLTHLCALLHHYGYSVDMRTHNCGEIGGLAQNRERFLLVARQREACMDYLREPPAKRVRTVGEALFHLPSPAANHGDRLHRLPGLSAMNQLRLAAIRAGKDWRDLPAEIRVGGKARRSGAYEVLHNDAPSKVIRGRHDVWAAPASVTDPRVGVDPSTAKPGSWAAKGRPDAYGVQRADGPATTVRARQEVQTSRRSVADHRVVDPKLTPRKARQNGGFGVNAADAGSHTVVGASTVRSAWASVADPRLTCKPRSGAYGMLDADEVGPTIIGYHKHDRAPASVADPRLTHAPRRGSFGLLDNNEPAPVIRGRHTVRQAPAALVDWRGWPVATHELVEEAGSLVLYGPELDLVSTRPRRDIVIRAPDGTWHRAMTTRELACLQSFPDDFVFEGSDSSSKTQPGIREHIGNAVPPDAAEAIAVECMVALMSSADGGYHLSNGNIWVRPEMEWAA